MTKRGGQDKAAGRSGGSRAGIALVIVLGMLALMMLVSVAFSVYMRTERIAASNHKNDVRVQLLLQACMNKALAEIDDMIPPGVTSIESVPGWTNGVYIGTPLPGIGPDPVFNTNNCFNKYVPGVLTGALSSAVGFQLFSTGNKGRYSYIALDCAGLLDANYTDGTNRYFGTNVHEVQIGHLREIPSPVSRDNFIFARENWFKRFESLDDVATLATNPAVGFTASPDVFMYYSRFSKPANVIDVGGSVSNLLADRAKITAGFLNALSLDPFVFGRQGYRAGVLFTNLIDYVDSDPMPGNLGNTSVAAVVTGPYVDSFPMLNEFQVTNRFRFFLLAGVTNLWNRFDIWAEFFQPRTNLSSSFTFHYDLDVYASPPYFPTRLTNSVAIPSASGNRYVKINDFLIYVTNNVILPVDVSIAVTGRMWVTWVDDKMVDLTTNISLNMTCPAPITIGTFYGVSGGKQCRDPRVNWNAGGSQWRSHMSPAFPISFGSDNPYMSLVMTPIMDGDVNFYVADRPLQVPGELGYLFMDEMYSRETLRLFMHNNNPNTIHPVLNTFVTGTDPAFSWKGKVNPQTSYPDVLAAVFTNMALDYPHGPGVVPIPTNNFTAVVNALLATNRASTFSDLADLGRVDWKLVLSNGLSEADCEGLIRNSSGLFSTRQHLFLILIHAEITRSVWHTGGTTYDEALSGERAVALLWRDPFPDPVSGKNRWMVRDFRVVDKY